MKGFDQRSSEEFSPFTVQVHGIEVARVDKKFLSNHGPKYNTYYAIYFTMTGLHGLHVVLGALVLAYMLFFQKKLYQQNP